MNSFWILDCGFWIAAAELEMERVNPFNPKSKNQNPKFGDFGLKGLAVSSSSQADFWRIDFVHTLTYNQTWKSFIG